MLIQIVKFGIIYNSIQIRMHCLNVRHVRVTEDRAVYAI